ncbi:MAG: hypothetical protein VB138_14820 [Burkholderia sp.]
MASGWTKLRQWLRRVLGFDRDEAPDDADIEAMESLSITSQLAAVPDAYLAFLPHDICDLIRQAKSLHGEIAMAQANQIAVIARKVVGFVPLHHVFRTTGQCYDNFVALPEDVPPINGASDAIEERKRIRAAIKSTEFNIEVCDPWGRPI